MTKQVLKGIGEVYISVSNPILSAKWYREKLDCKLIYFENDKAVLRMDGKSTTVICLVRTATELQAKNGVRNRYTFYTSNIGETYKALTERGVKINPLFREEAKTFTFHDPDGNIFEAWQTI